MSESRPDQGAGDPLRPEGVARSGPAAVPAWMVATPLPMLSKLLPQGEPVIVCLRPSMWFVVLSRLESLVGLACGTAVAVWLADREVISLQPRAVAGAGVAAAAFLMLGISLQWLTRLYVLTDKRAMVVSGVLRQTVLEAPLSRLVNIGLRRSLRERLTGVGTPIFATAAGIGEFAWPMVARPIEVVAAVRAATQRAPVRTDGGAAGGAI